LKLTNKFHIIVHRRNALEHSDTGTTLIVFLANFINLKFLVHKIMSFHSAVPFLKMEILVQ